MRDYLTLIRASQKLRLISEARQAHEQRLAKYAEQMRKPETRKPETSAK